MLIWLWFKVSVTLDGSEVEVSVRSSLSGEWAKNFRSVYSPIEDFGVASKSDTCMCSSNKYPRGSASVFSENQD